MGNPRVSPPVGGGWDQRPLHDEDEPTELRPVRVEPASRPQPIAPLGVVRAPSALKPSPIQSPISPVQSAAMRGRRNRLAAAAMPTLMLLTQLRFASRHPDVPGLQREVMIGLDRFESQATDAGYSAETIKAATYTLCTTLDETVLGTSWGFESEWGSSSLLTLRFRETWGGETVFAILDRLKGDPLTNLDLLELISMCMSLGFQGRYRTMAGGLFALEDLRQELERLCRSTRGTISDDLAPNVTPAEVGVRLRRFLPPPVAFALAACVAVIFFLWLDAQLNSIAEASLNIISSIINH